MTDTTAPQASFLIALPPGWMRLPAGAGDEAVLHSIIDEIVDEALPATLPRDKAEPWRGEMRKTIAGVVAEARDAGANAVYLPVRPVNGINVPASFVESEVDDDGAGDPGAVLAAMLADADAGALHVIDGAHAVRTDSSVVRVEPRDGWLEMTTRQIVYTIEVPHREGRWVVMSFSAASGDRPSAALSDALVELFDALMLTFRWSDVPGVDHSDLEERLAQIHSL
jgi:hypothetical protein